VLNTWLKKFFSEGMPLEKNSANVTSEARAQTSMITERQSVKRVNAPRLAFQAIRVSLSATVSPRCRRLLMSYSPVARNGPSNRNPAVRADVSSTMCWNTRWISRPISANAAP
jgi:hypothetical protein